MGKNKVFRKNSNIIKLSDKVLLTTDCNDTIVSVTNDIYEQMISKTTKGFVPIKILDFVSYFTDPDDDDFYNDVLNQYKTSDEKASKLINYILETNKDYEDYYICQMSTYNSDSDEVLYSYNSNKNELKIKFYNSLNEFLLTF